jgi:hypothetical protein
MNVFWPCRLLPRLKADKIGVFSIVALATENLKSYVALTDWTLYRWRNVSPVKYELGFYIAEDDILHSHSRENLKSY